MRSLPLDDENLQLAYDMSTITTEGKIYDFAGNNHGDMGTSDWLTGWSYRKSHIIESASGAGTDYQISINVSYGPGFGFGTITNWADDAHQGIATDGTYVYTTDTNLLSKYTKSGTFVDSRDTSSDGSEAGWTNGDLTYYNGNLYVAVDNYPTLSPMKGALLEYDASDLSYIAERAKEVWSGWYYTSVSFHDGSFWVTNGALTTDSAIASISTSWAFEAEYDFAYDDMSVNQDGYGYQGNDWYGDYLFTPMHEGQTGQTIDVHYFNGTAFLPHQRIDQLTFSNTGGDEGRTSQGIAFENDGGTWYAWFASRDMDAPDTYWDAVKAPLTFDLDGDGATVYLNQRSRTDFGDLRFTSSDGMTSLDYWMERSLDGSDATFWVEISDDLSSTDRTIYIYYGESDATDVSNGTATFLYFDDFEDGDFSNWLSMGESTVVSQETVDGRTAMKVDRETGTAGHGWRYVAYTTTTQYAVDALVQASVVASGPSPKIAWGVNTASTESYTGGNDGPGDAISTATGIQKNWAVTDYEWLFSDVTSFPMTIWLKQSATIDGDDLTLKLYNITTGLSFYSNSVSNADFDKDKYVGVRQYRYHSYYDDFRVRKFVSPEPQHGAWSSEESGGSLPPLVQGQFGLARDFSFNIVNTSLDIPPDEFTLVAAIEPQSISVGPAGILSKRTPGNEWTLYFQTDRTVRFLGWEDDSNITINLTSNAQLILNQSHIIGLRWDGLEACIWIDGSEDVCGSRTEGPIQDTTSPIRLGEDDQNASRFLDAIYDEVLIFTDVKTDLEMASLTTPRQQVVIGGGSSIIPTSVSGMLAALPYIVIIGLFGGLAFFIFREFKKGWA